VLDQPVVKIGRSAANDIQLSGSTVSRYHIELRQTREGWILTDQNTRFGTKVNGIPVTAPRVLRDRDEITIGTLRLAFYSSMSPDALAGPPRGQRMRQRDLTALLDKLRPLATTGSLDELLILVLDTAIHLGHAERGFVMLKNEQGELQFRVARARGGVSLPGTSFSTSRKIPEQVFSSGQEIFVADLLDGDLSSIHHGTVALGIRHVWCAPIKTATQSLGVIYLDTREKGILPSPGVRTALGILVSEAANALDQMSTREVAQRSRALEQEISAAAEVQRALRPVQDVHGSYYIMATRTSSPRTFGGELVDHFVTASNSVAIVTLDVSGHGAPAGVMQSYIQGLLKANSHHMSPSTVIGDINTAVVSHQMESRFATAFYGHLWPTGDFSYCNAGHSPPILFAGSEMKRLETGGTVIGLFEHPEYEQGFEQLRSGDTVVAFSADVTEATNTQGEEFGEDRIVQIVRMHLNEEPAVIADAVLSSVERFATSGRADLTVTVVRYNGVSAS
jgi:serine phosphatase RsbU (regulator of sigma subunit)